MTKTFKAFQVREEGEKQFLSDIVTRQIDDLPAGEVLIRVHYSSLNYKDALSASGNKGVTRNYPHTPGVDAAGIVEESQVSDFSPGDEVIVCGFDLGMNTSGAYAEYIRVPAKWVLPRPQGLSLRDTMAYGTAGVTAGLCIAALEHNHISPDKGKIVVSGASGGVGSMAVAILAKLGYEVVAVTGKPHAHALMKQLGASEIVGRAEVDDQSKKPLLRPKYAGAVDTVGGNILATIIKSTHYDGCVTCCGLVASPKLETTVFPFILKGVTLQGIDSVESAISRRQAVWEKLGSEWKVDALSELTQECSLEELPSHMDAILKGQIMGRVVVKI